MNRLCLPLALVGVLLVGRVLLVGATPFDTDEGQHLHLAHGIALGELPYRDRFDNHTPLFHFGMAPVMAALGERPAIVRLVRWMLVPVALLALGFFVFAAARAFGLEVALWAAAVLLAMPDWALSSMQVRPDVALMALWFGALALLVRRSPLPSAGAWFAAGLLLGVGLLFSLKALYLFAALGGGALCVAVARLDGRPGWRPFFAAIGAAVLGFGLPVAAGLVSVRAAGLWDDAVLCLVRVNGAAEAPGLLRLALIPSGLLCAAVLAGLARSRRRGFLLAVAVVLAALLFGSSPSLRKQTLLPLIPLLVLGVVALARRQRRIGLLRDLRVPGCAAVLGFWCYGLFEAPPWRDGLASHEALIETVLARVPPGQTIMDTKGETIFRRRPASLVYVGATKRALRAGLVEDDAVAGAVRHGTMFATDAIQHLPKASRRFFSDHYQPAAHGLRVLAAPVAGGRAQIAVPASYVLLVGGRRTPWPTAGEPSARTLPVGEVSVAAPNGSWLVAEPAAGLLEQQPHHLSPAQ